MGQAKSRGNYNERLAAAITRDTAIAAEREQIQQEKIAATLPQNRELNNRNKCALLQTMAMIAAFSNPFVIRKRPC